MGSMTNRTPARMKLEHTPKGRGFHSFRTFLYRSLDDNNKMNISKWRNLVNQGETMGADDLVTNDNKNNKDQDSKPPPKKSGKGKKERRVTRTRRIGVPDDTVRIKLASSNSDYIEASNLVLGTLLSSSYDSNTISKSDHSMVDDDGISRLRALKKTSSIGMSRGSIRYPPYAVIDPGVEKEIVVGVGWRILHFSDRSEILNGPLDGMGSSVLPLVDAVTAVEASDGSVVLLGIGDASYDRRTTQNESLWDSHHLRSNNVKVDDVAKEAGGDQCMSFKNQDGKDIIIPLKFNGDIMTVDLREPSDKELLALRVNW